MVIHEYHKVIDHLFRYYSHAVGIASLHAQEADGSISIARVSGKVVEAPLGFLDVFGFCFQSMTSAFCVLVDNSEQLRVHQWQLSASTALHVDEDEMPDVV